METIETIKAAQTVDLSKVSLPKLQHLLAVARAHETDDAMQGLFVNRALQRVETEVYYRVRSMSRPNETPKPSLPASSRP